MTNKTPTFRPIDNAATGERIQFINAPETSDGQSGSVLRFHWQSQPGGAITEHIHPHQEERFIITAGEAHFTLKDTPHILHAGETLTVPVGVRHSQHNPGTVAIQGIVELRPALNSKKMHETFAGLSSEGKTNARGAPKSPLQLGATIWHFRRESRVTAPPPWAQNLILAPLAVIAKAFGVPAYNKRWDSQL